MRTDIDFRNRIAHFVEDRVLPLEADLKSYDTHENIRLDLANALRAQARAERAVALIGQG